MTRRGGSRQCGWRDLGQMLLIGSAIIACRGVIEADPGPGPSAGPQETSASLPATMTFNLGELRSLVVEEIGRVAVGNPAVLDVTVVTPRELLLQAKATGNTTLILWDGHGRHVTQITVVDLTQDETATHLRALIAELGFTGVQVKRENGKVFLTGSLATKDAFDHLEQLASSFKDVTNLVTVTPVEASPVTPPLVKLEVQIVDIARLDAEKLGVSWPESIKFTEQPFSVTGGSASTISTTDAAGNPLKKRVGEVFRVGNLFRGGFETTINALVTQNRARVLAEPKLVTASGKEATTFVGVQVPILKSTSTGNSNSAPSANIEYRDTGVTLKMTPDVLKQPGASHQHITLVIESEVSDIDKSVTLTVPVGSATATQTGFKVSKTKTEVTMTSGETMVLAGLLKVDNSLTVSQVPALGSMPILGRLFRSPETTDKQRELIMVVTPEVLTETEENTAAAPAPSPSPATQPVVAAMPTPQAPQPHEVVQDAADRALERTELIEQAFERQHPSEEESSHLVLHAYTRMIQERLARAIPSAKKTLLPQGVVQVTLRLHLVADGTLKQVSIDQSSGIDALDQSVLATAKQHVYPPIPPETHLQEVWLLVPIRFQS